MGMWNDTSRKAAYEQFGKDNWRLLALWHAAPKILAVGALVGLFFLARAGYRAYDAAPTPSMPWGPVALVAGAAFGLLVLYRLATRTRRRGYRLPKRY
jgi:hypothetical protein